jgi:signal transduction histidine kinase
MSATLAPDIVTVDSPAPTLSRRLTRIFLALALWTSLGLFFASQIWLLGGPGITWGVALRLAMPRWDTWGLLAPGIARVDRWVGAGRTLTARLAWHAPLALGWNAAALVIRLFARPLVGNPWPPSIVDFVLQRIYWDLLIYAVIAGVSIARDYAAQVREQERRSHALQIESLALQQLLTEARLQSLRSQLQPHFLFNALNTISALTETDPKTARRLMEQLGGLLRVSLRHASTPLVTLAEELTFLDDYLAIESVRFEGRITVAVRADDDALAALTPGFLLQPLVENAIRHGVGPRLSGGHVSVTAAREGDRLRLRVCDNGLGLSPDWSQRRDIGVGLRNTAARLEQLYPHDHLFRVQADPEGGVDVRIEVPWQSSPVVAAAGATRAHA